MAMMRIRLAIAVCSAALFASQAWGQGVSYPGANATSNTSSTITTGATFQTIAAANGSRKSVEFVNVCNISGNCVSTSDNCYLFFAISGSPTTAKSVVVGPGQEYLRSQGSIPADAIQATCDGTADKYYLAVQ